MTKRLLHTLIAIGLCTALPVSAQAADRINLDPVNLGDTTITAQFDNAQKGEWYHLYIGNTFLSGQVTADDVKAGKKTFDLPANTGIREGTVVRFEMPSFGNTYLKADRTVGSATGEQDQTVGKDLRVTYPTTAHPGEQVSPKITLVKDGSEQDVAQDAVYSYNGPIVPGSFIKGGFIVEPDAQVGETVNVTVMHGDERADVTIRITGNGGSAKPGSSEQSGDIQTGALKQDKVSVPTGDATVTLTPNSWPQNATRAYLILRYKSNPGATTTMQINNLQTMAQDKKVVTRLGASADTVASYNIVFTNAAGNEVTRLPFDVRFGQTGLKDNQVSMTIGLQTIAVGETTKTIDTAPFIQDGRTFVPLRALAEAFGADVQYNESNREITIKDNGTTVVMRLDDTTYSVNGENKTMDLAPYVSDAGRTIVPVRFAAQGLGYKIDVRYDAQGLTDHIIFEA